MPRTTCRSERTTRQPWCLLLVLRMMPSMMKNAVVGTLVCLATWVVVKMTNAGKMRSALGLLLMAVVVLLAADQFRDVRMKAPGGFEVALLDHLSAREHRAELPASYGVASYGQATDAFAVTDVVHAVESVQIVDLTTGQRVR